MYSQLKTNSKNLLIEAMFTVSFALRCSYHISIIVKNVFFTFLRVSSLYDGTAKHVWRQYECFITSRYVLTVQPNLRQICCKPHNREFKISAGGLEEFD